jgi:hypothetical protein
MGSSLNLYPARFASIELEWGEEVYIFNGVDVPPGKQAQSGFRKRLDAHHSGQHRSSVDLVIVQEWLFVWIQSCFDRAAI